MGDTVQIQRKIFGKTTFSNVVDTEFNQLVPKEEQAVVKEDATVDSFFASYDTLFYDIPPSGSIKSHLEIVTRSSEYLGVSLEDLQQEIINLREENVALKKQLFSLSNPDNK